MAVDANSLTRRDNLPPDRGSPPWTAPSGEFRVLIDGLEALGFERQVLLEAGGLAEQVLDDPDARVSCEAYGRVIGCAQRTRRIPNIALQLARRTPLGTYPLLDYLVLTSDTVGAGVTQLARYFKLVGNPVVITIQEAPERVRVQMTPATAAFAVEFTASLLVLHLRTETDGPFSAEQISFAHQPDDPDEFAELLGCPIVLASWSGVVVPRRVWELPLRRRDETLRHLLEGRADEILARLPVRPGVAHDVQRLLAGRRVRDQGGMEEIARQLGMSSRTLQRRLAGEGVSYQQLLDEARKEAAGRLLADARLGIGEVAYLVGYSEPAPFHRAFRRWYGVTPDAFRQRP